MPSTTSSAFPAAAPAARILRSGSAIPPSCSPQNVHQLPGLPRLTVPQLAPRPRLPKASPKMLSPDGSACDPNPAVRRPHASYANDAVTAPDTSVVPMIEPIASCHRPARLGPLYGQIATRLIGRALLLPPQPPARYEDHRATARPRLRAPPPRLRHRRHHGRRQRQAYRAASRAGGSGCRVWHRRVSSFTSQPIALAIALST